MASDDVVGLSDRDHVRKRYGMYIGSVDNPQIAVREIIDNSIDEVLVGRANIIKVFSDKIPEYTYYSYSSYIEDGFTKYSGSKVTSNNLMRYTVADNGGGIPIKMTRDISGNAITMTEYASGYLRAGSKFDKEQAEAGTNGVGSSVVNMLAAEYVVYSQLVHQDKESTIDSIKKLDADWSDPCMYYKLVYNTGIKVSECIVNINDEDIINDDLKKSLPSTIVSFIPDPDVWKTQSCSIPMNTRYLKYICNHDGRETHFYINGKESTEVPNEYKYSLKVRINNTETDVANKWMEFYCSFGINEDFDSRDYEYSVNTLSTQRGHHVSIAESAYVRAFESIFGSTQGHALKAINFLVIFKCPEPVFSSQTKERLSDIPGFNPWIDYPELTDAFKKIIQDNYDEFAAQNKRIHEYIASLVNLTRLDQIKSMITVSNDMDYKRSSASAWKPIKLKDCLNTDRERSELVICEGESAGAALTQARAGMDNIAVLPLRGRPMNATGRDIEEILDNNEYYDLINSIGLGVNEYHSLDQIRYGKVIICTDADPDGFAIANLVIGVVLLNMTFLIDNGMLYIARCPLYEQNGNYYYYGDEDKLDRNKEVQRFKGLGSMNPDQLNNIVLNPNTRRLYRVTVGNIDYARALLSSPITRKNLMREANIITDEVLPVGGEFDE